MKKINHNYVKTGIKGFDSLIKGGFPVGSTILINGTPGTGKTIFALQYIHHGALNGEKCLYIALEETKEQLKRQALQFGWNLESFEKKGYITFLQLDLEDIKHSTVEELINIIQKEGYSHVIVDSLSAIAFNIPSTNIKVTDITELSIIRFVYNFIHRLQRVKECTSILISHVGEGNANRESAAEYLCDGIINITYESVGGDYSRSLSIRKMRLVKNDENVHPLEIGKKGIVIHSLK